MYYSTSKGSEKPAKPRPDFPLFPHATGRWAKKIRGKLHYFGKWADPDAALQRYVEERDDLYAGRKPRRNREGLTVKDLVNKFLLAKKAKVDAGELALGTFGDQYKTCKRDRRDVAIARQARALSSGPYILRASACV
jgi:hypothetical protein